ncbi:hypothetical protein DFR86_09085 [Acidianus sulfidivorans JP7]|uniref:Uncharacterized protein n=1 Tax=Acidianus sulfidivorans JP7 TaxID=619593 RepID=A0A2U9INY0_9CREN|nr:hypothetical protein [Acidianus sulfidivorans]AWR97684.1 hypothetical protein DFR86_09085 [Acidianus sulfidivorans JP7]
MLTLTRDIEVTNPEAIMNWAKDQSNIISIIPNVVKIQGNVIELRFTRLFLFSFDSYFNIQLSIIGNGLIEYKLTDKKDNELKIFLTADQKKYIKIGITYSGEKEWVISKGLKKILDEIILGIQNEMNKFNEVNTQTLSENNNYSVELSKISYISKLIIKTKLAKSEEVTLNQGEVLDYVEGIISGYSNYPIIYISGSGSSTFRLLFINGELKGVYILQNGKASFEEDGLNYLSGDFKIHVYVGISPRIAEVIKE